MKMHTWLASLFQDKGDLLELQATDFIITEYITYPKVADSTLNPLSSLLVFTVYRLRNQYSP